MDLNVIKRDIKEKYGLKSHIMSMISEMVGKRNVYIWGAVQRNKFWLELEQYHVNVIGFIDKTGKFSDTLSVCGGEEKPVFLPDEVDYENCYIIVGLDHIYEDVKCFLREKGLKEYTDYYYPGKNRVSIGSIDGEYEDNSGNLIYGNVSKCNIALGQGGNCIFIGQHADIENLKIEMSGGAIVIIEDDVSFPAGKLDVKRGGVCILKRNVRFHEKSTIIVRNGYIEIGENTTIMSGKLDAAFSTVYVGNDCMLAEEVNLQGWDGHLIWDFDNQKFNINAKKRCEIKIGNHVWLGRRCCIRYGAKIGNGSIVGINSYVDKKFPENCIIAGNPAVIRREGVAWSRDPNDLWEIMDYDKYYRQFDFKEYKDQEVKK